jgi:hypothetical protein
MALDAGRACVFLVVDEDHCAECVRRFRRGRTPGVGYMRGILGGRWPRVKR